MLHLDYIPAHHSDDEAGHFGDLDPHPPSISVDNAFRDLIHKADIVVKQTSVA